MKTKASMESRFSERVVSLYARTGLPRTLDVRAATGDAPTEILLYDEIGPWGVTAKDFVLALAAAGEGAINLRINSPGGDVFDGLAIYNAMKARGAPVNVFVDGLAASAASFIAMAGTTVTMGEQSMMMVHDAWGFAIGNRNDMLETAALLEKVDGQLAAIYAAKTGKPVATIAAMMDAETWFTAAEARDYGLADAVAEAAQATQTTAHMDARASLAIAASLRTRTARADLPTYDPDGDGDNDAQEALGLIQSAAVLLAEACEALSGSEDDGEGADDPSGLIVPGASTDHTPTAGTSSDIAALRRRLRLAEAMGA